MRASLILVAALILVATAVEDSAAEDHVTFKTCTIPVKMSDGRRNSSSGNTIVALGPAKFRTLRTLQQKDARLRRWRMRK